MKTNFLEYNLMNNPVRSWIQKNIEIKPFLQYPTFKSDIVLEIGCGNGYGAKLINKYFQPKHISGIDIDEKMIKKAVKRKISNATFTVGSATNLIYPNNFFDSIFDFGVIHHIPNWKKCIDEMHRILKKDGHFYIEDFSKESFVSPIGKLLKKVLKHPYQSMYSVDELFSYLKEVGFNVKMKQKNNIFGLINYFVVICTK